MRLASGFFQKIVTTMILIPQRCPVPTDTVIIRTSCIPKHTSQEEPEEGDIVLMCHVVIMQKKKNKRKKFLQPVIFQSQGLSSLAEPLIVTTLHELKNRFFFQPSDDKRASSTLHLTAVCTSASS